MSDDLPPVPRRSLAGIELGQDPSTLIASGLFVPDDTDEYLERDGRYWLRGTSSDVLLGCNESGVYAITVREGFVVDGVDLIGLPWEFVSHHFAGSVLDEDGEVAMYSTSDGLEQWVRDGRLVLVSLVES